MCHNVNRFSPAWEHRIRTGACALLQVANLISFLYFVTNYTTGDFLMKTILTHPCILQTFSTMSELIGGRYPEAESLGNINASTSQDDQHKPARTLSLSVLFQKREVIALISLGIMAAFYGLTLTGVIIAIMIGMALIGKCLQGIKVLPQVVGLLVLAYILPLLDKLPWLKISQHVMYSNFVYSGFYAQVVRAMLICCDYASESEPITWRRLMSESIGFTAFTNVFMPASFIVFSDWKQWYDGEHEYIWSGSFKLVPKKRVGKATEIRTLSLLRLAFRILQVAFLACVHKYCMCGVNIISILSPRIDRVIKNQIEISDMFVINYATALVLLRFNIYYIIYYKISRLVGDFQQFLLSPAFSPNSDKMIGGNENVKKAWKKTNIIEKLFKVGIETECLMPGGPCWTMSTVTSSEIWRKFDIGLYNFLKYYVYIPWMDVVNGVFCRGDEVERSKLSSLLSNISATCGALLTFLFVLTFHHWTMGNKIWVTFSFTYWLIERIGIQYFQKNNISEYLVNRFSPAWEHRIRTGACALLQVANFISFLYFVTNYTTGDFLMKNMLIHPCKLTCQMNFTKLH
ncbi:unnamed protein product [Rodentolepis nana]|uniref:PIEZO domain-containing protein n=1 Tax=Rodentolepis nana TaxID=102285 RepID=A0A158QJJ8_RODNA|nr:unnamed protein product [Rodentolepis nana]